MLVQRRELDLHIAFLSVGEGAVKIFEDREEHGKVSDMSFLEV